MRDDALSASSQASFAMPSAPPAGDPFLDPAGSCPVVGAGLVDDETPPPPHLQNPPIRESLNGEVCVQE